MTQLNLFLDAGEECYYVYARAQEGKPETFLGKFAIYKDAVSIALHRDDPPPIEYPIRLNDDLEVFVLKPYGKKPRRRS